MAIIASSFIVLEDGTRNKEAGTTVYEGTPMTINENGNYEPAAAGDKVYGISKLDSNQYQDYAWGEFGAFGSGMLTVVCKGILLLGPSIYNEMEVDSSTTTASAPVIVKLFDDTKEYTPMEPLYVDGSGLITNAPTDKTSLFGKVVSTPVQNGGYLEVEVDPPVTSVAADLK